MHILSRIGQLLLLLALGIQPLTAQHLKDFSLVPRVLDTLPAPLGVAGPFTGLLGESQNTLLIAGGANFAEPVWESPKKYHNQGYLFRNLDLRINRDQNQQEPVTETFELPWPIAYGSSVSLAEGVLCLGGHNADSLSSAVFLIRDVGADRPPELIHLPSLPLPLTHSAAVKSGEFVYVVGGQTGSGLESATNLVWRLRITNMAGFLADPSSGYPDRWEILPDFQGKPRAFHLLAAQHDGRQEQIYLVSGRRLKDHHTGNEPIEFLTDVWMFDPTSGSWTEKSPIPVCVMAGSMVAYGQSHLFVMGGADGSLLYQADSLRENHPGFPKTAWAYHTLTDTWTALGELAENQVTTQGLIFGEDILIPSGEIKPRVRTNKIWLYSPSGVSKSFGWLNYLTLFSYLAAMLLVGVYFARRNKSTNDFFRGGQRIPWWAAACSIFATMLSSLTYMSVPAKAYMTNWEYLMGYPAILLTSILVIYLVMPFFRKIDATSAYEYLEKRFNKGARYLGSGFFILFQIGRMAIVMFLSALALAAITPFTPAESILIMGVLSILYSTLGGVEAVIWTDTIQTFVLLGGAILIFVLVILRLDGGMGEFVRVAAADEKFRMINWDWDLMSYTTAALWVIVLGSFGQNMVSYGSDQAVVQRYMTTADKKKSARSILANGIMSVPAGLLFFGVGAALYVFYKSHPANLNPAFQNDAIMPLFIVSEIPAGIAGLIIAGIFAAAQSTISTSMNSTATAATTDFLKPWNVCRDDRHYLRLARWMTVVFGTLGTGLALVFASADIKSLLDQFFAIIGLFGGALGGLFMLGMFTRKASGSGAVTGAILGALVLFLVSRYTQTHVYLYAAVGIVSTMVFGWLLSLPFPSKKDISGLTIFDLKKHE